MERLWANLIKEGARTLDEAPERLKEKIKKILIESGYEELVEE